MDLSNNLSEAFLREKQRSSRYYSQKNTISTNTMQVMKKWSTQLLGKDLQ
jgi:hypothetical protein